MRELLAAGKSGKTAANYTEALVGFCNWCVDRDYLEANPLAKLQRFDITPVTMRRAMTVEEVQRLLAAVTPRHQVLYELAICTGLRKGEIRSLTVAHLNVARSGLHLDAAWTKNRRAGFQPLPKRLAMALAEQSADKDNDDRLLWCPSNTDRMIAQDLEKAGIPAVTEEGKLDFHALRTTFTTFVIESGATVKEAQTLLRHSTPILTMNTYARVRKGALQNVADQVGNLIAQREKRKECMPVMRLEVA